MLGASCALWGDGLVRLVVLVFLLSGAIPAHAQASRLLIEQLTSPELRQAIAGGKTTILVPIGGTEQNGPHMVLGKHNVRARLLAERIAERLGDALVAPVVAYVPEGNVTPPAGHMRFAGTISVPEDAFEKMLAGAARSFRQHGFRYVVLLGDHGGYRRSLEKVAADVNREWRHTNARVIVPAEYYRAATVDFGKALATEGFRPAQVGVHAGLADTSLALALDPSLVRRELLGAEPGPGVEGDPRRSTVDLGDVGVALIVEKTVNAIREATGKAAAAKPVR
jgi:creatinine amidohydrolase/Fe(II)-dependent formamide hydrolase-like protein